MAVEAPSKEDALKAQVADLKAQLSALDKANVNFSRELKAAQVEAGSLAAAKAENADLEKQLRTVNLRVSALESDLSAAKAEVDKAKDVLAAGQALKNLLSLV